MTDGRDLPSGGGAMTDQVEEQLRTTLARRAAAVTAAAIAPDLVVREGRAARRRHRVAAASAVAASVAVVLLVVGALTTGARRHSVGPPYPSVTSTVDSISAAAARLTVLSGRTIALPDGTRTVLELPPGVIPTTVVRAAGGWVVASQGDLWLAPDRGSARWLFPNLGSPDGWAVSADGRTLVVLDGDVAAYDLATMTQQRRTSLDRQRTYHIMALRGDRALLTTDATTAVWTISTGALAEGPLSVVDVSRNGQVLRRVPNRAGVWCYDIVPVATVLAAASHGYCTTDPAFLSLSTLSPDARWITATTRPLGPVTALDLYHSDDLMAGRARATPVSPSARVLLWPSATTFLTQTSYGSDSYFLCDTSGQCARVTFPLDLPDAQPITRLDGVAHP